MGKKIGGNANKTLKLALKYHGHALLKLPVSFSITYKTKDVTLVNNKKEIVL